MLRYERSEGKIVTKTLVIERWVSVAMTTAHRDDAVSH